MKREEVKRYSLRRAQQIIRTHSTVADTRTQFSGVRKGCERAHRRARSCSCADKTTQTPPTFFLWLHLPPRTPPRTPLYIEVPPSVSAPVCPIKSTIASAQSPN
eukprot:4783235-Pleurochrysis_carterae.AAC.1